MNRSSKFNFFLPQNTDPIEVSDFNSNFETIDANLLTKAQSLTETQKSAVRANVDLNVANNLTTTAAGYVLDARMGKTLNDKIEKLNSESNTTNDILVDALNVTGTKFFKAGSNYTGSVPNSFYKYGTFEVFTRGTTKIVIAQSQTGEMAINSYYSSAWSGWNELALNSKIAYDWNSFANYVSSLETGANGIILRLGKMRTISFQGASRTHTEDEVLATLPEADRPTAGNIFASANIGSSSVVIRIGTNGQVTLYSLNGVTASGRVYFNAAYAIG